MFKKFNLKNLDKKTLIYLGIGFGMILLLIIILVILKATISKRIGSKQYETKVKEAAISYYKKYPDKLPQNNGMSITVSIDELVNENLIKSQDKLLNKGLSCSGNVNVSNNNGYYLYQPIIECSDDYKTSLLYTKILENNPIKARGNGLYKINDYYLFRGEEVNNYASFADKKWYILRINEDNTIKMVLIDDLKYKDVWDDRYNSSIEKYYGKNDFSISRIRDDLEYYYNDIFEEDDKALIVPKELCVGARSIDAESIDGSIECSKKTDKSPLGLLQTNELVIASIDPECKGIYDLQCTNYNYLTSLSDSWTLNAVAENSYQVYKLSRTIPYRVNANQKSQPRIVLNISANALYKSGTGTSEDPYIIK